MENKYEDFFFFRKWSKKDHKQKKMSRKHMLNSGQVQEVYHLNNRITECESRENKRKKSSQRTFPRMKDICF